MLNWGIAGASEIASNFCAALNSSQPTNAVDHKIVAIASRSLDAAKIFATKYKISQVYDSYGALALDSQVEIVYVAVTNPQHYEVVSMMLKRKKHVVCEKPLAMNNRQTSHLIALAQKQKVFLMEALWSRFFPVYQHLSTVLETLSRSDVREIYIKHGYQASEMKNVVHKDLGGGVTLNFSSYAIQLVLFVFRDEPKSIQATGKINSFGIDLHCEVQLAFSLNRKAHIICSSLQRLENSATIITTKGPICIPLYWRPTMYMALGEIHEWPPLRLASSSSSSLSENYYYTNAIGLKNGADEIAKYVRLGSLSCPVAGHEETKRISKIQDEIRKQLKVHYTCDNI